MEPTENIHDVIRDFLTRHQPLARRTAEISAEDALLDRLADLTAQHVEDGPWRAAAAMFGAPRTAA